MSDPTTQRRVAAIVLAGGLASRMEGSAGQTKVLLPWDNRPILQVIIDKLKQARLDDIIVVTGHLADQVREAIANEPVRVVHNADYRDGEIRSSLQTGIRALGPEVAACLVVLGDQPDIQPPIVSKILAAYAEGRGHIIVPTFQNQRGHPILFDRLYWPEILNLSGDQLPREVIKAHPDAIESIPVTTDSILRDIDTRQDYEQERRRAGLI